MRERALAHIFQGFLNELVSLPQLTEADDLLRSSPPKIASIF
jgi:hypothetical protein